MMTKKKNKLNDEKVTYWKCMHCYDTDISLGDYPLKNICIKCGKYMDHSTEPFKKGVPNSG